MARGPKKHLKRVNAPSHWMLDKLGGNWAPRPSAGPHKLRECLPISILLRNRLKYALTLKEVSLIVHQRLIKIDGKVRTDVHYPAGFQDVVSIEQTKELYRLLLDTKGRFSLVKIDADEARFKLCRVKRKELGFRGVPYIATHDGRTIRYPDPDVEVNDTVKVDIESGKIVELVKFEVGNLCMITGGNNIGRVGVITSFERHPGSFNIVHLKDSTGASFATREANVFALGKGNKSLVKLPRGKGVKLSVIEERNLRMSKAH
eukprot:GILI01000481.1.p1 GENE.GILI01000481.1~~GILI01000481.1.p1  ORF type:complete len:261 (+),score=83.66 GILI01000481.1:57-839(+)